MHRLMGSKLLCLVLIGFAADVPAQSLAEVAAREKERRSKLDSTRPAKSYGEEEVANAKGSTYSQMEGPAVKTPASTIGQTARALSSGATSGPTTRMDATSRPESSRDEAYWRGRASQLRAAVPAAEARVKQGEVNLVRTTYSFQTGCPGPTAGSIDEVKEIPRAYPCKPTTQDDVDRAQTALDQARVDLERARQELGGLEEDARRAGALPGWIR